MIRRGTTTIPPPTPKSAAKRPATSPIPANWEAGAAPRHGRILGGRSRPPSSAPLVGAAPTDGARLRRRRHALADPWPAPSSPSYPTRRGPSRAARRSLPPRRVPEWTARCPGRGATSSASTVSGTSETTSRARSQGSRAGGGDRRLPGPGRRGWPIEDKGLSLSFHFREASDEASRLCASSRRSPTRQTCSRARRPLGPQGARDPGLRSEHDKGTAVRALIAGVRGPARPLRGRRYDRPRRVPRSGEPRPRFRRQDRRRVDRRAFVARRGGRRRRREPG